MKIGHVDAVPATPVEMEGVEGVKMRVLVGPDQGARNFVMRVFDVAPGGHTPHHAHDFEHEVFVLGGAGTLVEEGQSASLEPGDAVYVAPGAVHQFRASGEGLRFMCVVPRS